MIIKGAIKRVKGFYFDYSVAFRNLYYLPNRIYQHKKKNTFKNSFMYP